MSKFKLDKQKARVINVNPRKEAAGDDKGATLATDVKLEIEDFPASKLRDLCEANGDYTLVDALFTDAGVPKFNGISGIALSAEFENADANVYGQQFQGAKVKKFRVTKLLDGAKVNLRFTLQIHPTGNALGAISEKLKEEVRVSIQPQKDLLDEAAA